MPRRILFVVAALLGGLLTVANAAGVPSSPLPIADAADLGFDAGRLDRLHNGLRGYVDEGRCSGFVTLIARNGHVVDWRTYGNRDIGTHAPMEKDTIFRIYSNTKLITAVGAMMLFEDGLLELDDPVEKYLPELRNRQVLTGGTADLPQLTPSSGSITIRMLLTHTAGYTYDFLEGAPLATLYERANLWEAPSLREFVARVATLPLAFQPGAEFRYGINMDILGAVIERVSGQDLETFFQNRLFGPLKMVDTSFDVTAGKMPRLAKTYQRGPDGKLVEATPISASWPEAGRAFPSGGGGLFSTTGDYARFAQMLLNRGELDGVRILGRKTVETMTLNQLVRTGKPTHAFSAARGFGLGPEVVIDPAKDNVLSSAGQFGWYGAATTFCQIDPAEGIVAIAFFQHMPMNEFRAFRRFANGYNAALVDIPVAATE